MSLKSGIPAWVAYDFINSLLIINGSLYFSAWVTIDQGVNSAWYGLAYVASTILLLICLPYKGAFLDRSRTGREVLIVLSIIIAVIAGCLPGIAMEDNWHIRVILALIAFSLINFLYQASLVSYNWTLVHLRGVVGSPERVREVSGYGEAAGSLGSVFGAFLGVWLIGLAASPESFEIFKIGGSGRIGMFIPLAFLFLILVLVDFWLLGKGSVLLPIAPNVAVNTKTHSASIREMWNLINATPQLKRFYLAFFLFADGLLTVQLYLPIYMRERLHLSDSDTATMFVIALSTGALGAFAYARRGRNMDTRKVLLTALWSWIGTLLIFGFIENLKYFMVLMGWCGILYGVVWSSARAHLIELVPQEMIGRAFSFYAVFDRTASILGPLIWGGIMLLSLSGELKYKIAFFVMSLMIFLGVYLLHNHTRVTPAYG